MSELEALPSVMDGRLPEDRRSEPRQPVVGMLWMVDHDGDTVLPCHCLEASPVGMRLRVPLGYGVAEGQRYELRSHLPGARPIEGFGLTGCRWATVVRAQVCLEGQAAHVDVGVTLDAVASTSLSVSATKALV
jgi:hypothetical protein